VTYLVPLFANIIGVVFLDETLSLRILLCVGLILLGTAMANGMFMPAFLRRR
jgi:drug/metabolite transporter (DMT)-like permease